MFFGRGKLDLKRDRYYANKPKEVKLIDRDCNRWLSKDLGKIYWTVGYWNVGFFNDIGSCFLSINSWYKSNRLHKSVQWQFRFIFNLWYLRGNGPSIVVSYRAITQTTNVEIRSFFHIKRVEKEKALQCKALGLYILKRRWENYD